MNLKVLAISTVAGVGIIAVSLIETQPAPRKREVERMASVGMAAEGYPAAAIAPAPGDFAASPPSEASGSDSLEIPAADFAVGLPQIAYVFSYGFRLAGPDIPALQQRHADLCERKGPLVCRIIARDQSTESGDDSAGTLQLAVASSEARAFGRQLATAAEDADAEQISAAISGEDLSKQIVDTDARLRARTLLRDRLMEVLATRRGTVTELVAAERGVAQVNEEIDQARSWLAEMKGRVAFSQIDIRYEGAVAPQPTRGFMDPVRGAVGSLGAIFGSILAVLIVLGAVGLPALAGALGARQLWRRFGMRPSEA